MITLRTFDTKHEIDPYKASTGGLTKTACELDPENETIDVFQRRSGDGTTMAYYHGLIIGINLAGEFYGEANDDPDAEELRGLLIGDEGQALLQRIVDGFSAEWDGSNHIGRRNMDSNIALHELESAINLLSRTAAVAWTSEEWCNGYEKKAVNVRSTPEQIAEAAKHYEDMLDDGHYLVDDMTDHLTNWVTYQRRELGPLTTEEAAEQLGVSTRRIRAMITSGRLPAKKYGRDWIIDAVDLFEKVSVRRPGRPKAA